MYTCARFALAGLLLVVSGPGSGAAVAAEPLAERFAAPPAAYRPHTWWHWIDGNIAKDGITADLEAMKQAGIGGAHIFNAGGFGGNDAKGNVVTMPKGPINYNTPEWRAMMVHAFQEAKRLGLEITIHNCCGWSSSGGPWVKPEDAMKKVVWSATVVQGPAEVDLALKEPQKVDGFYRDIAVFALPDTKIPTRVDEHQAYLTGLGDNDGKPFGEIKWPVVRREDMVDVTAGVKDGRLAWKAPAGRWTILRMGYTLTGAQNVASSDSGRGLEVDKLSAESLDRFFDDGLLPLIKEAGPLCGDSFTTVLIDSYETWRQNWTAKMREEFGKRRGYDLMPYLPALVGVAVDNADTTQRFLFDFRRTIEEMWADNYCGQFAKRLKEYNLRLGVEPYGNGDFNSFSYSASAGLIMGEYWVGEGTIGSSVKLAASVAHVLGQSVVGAESLTAAPDRAGWRNHPGEWKPFADRGYTHGINRIIYHRFTHQPWANPPLPGMTMGPWGSHNDRTQTWWPMAASWNEYLSRCQYLLQSGQFVADVCLYAGEDAPLANREEMRVPEVPRGYDYDLCGAQALMSAWVKDGRVALPTGMSYRVLALPEGDWMSAAVAGKVHDLVKAGATVVGPVPKRSVGLQEMGKGDAEVKRLMAEAGPETGKSVADVLRKIKLPPDFRCDSPAVSAIHRRIGDVDAYFVAWFGRMASEQKCFFRVEGRRPELWHPETGSIEEVPVWQAVALDTPGGGAAAPRAGRSASAGVSRVEGGVEIPLRFEPAGSVFVVFEKKAAGADPIVAVKADLPAAEQAAPVQIVKAEYGKLDEKAKTVDVTKRVADAVAASGEVQASNGAMGGDPAYLVVKSLRVTYVDQGREQTVMVPENETFRPGAVVVKPPAWELRVDGGKASLLAWQTGKYDLRRASGADRQIDAVVPAAVEVAGPWSVSFPPGWDAPAKTTFDKLISWTDSSDTGIKYFSGTATYTKAFDVPADLVGSGRRLVLDLGSVREIARVRVNGKDFGVMWWPPYRVDVTNAVKAGENTLEVRVTNLWVNRLVGDEQYPDDIGWQGPTFSKWPEWLVKGQPRPEPRRKTFTTWHHNTKDTPLIPSGLLGPVMLRPVVVYPVR